MQIIIDIPNWLYNAMMECKEPHYSKSLGDAVRNGKPLDDVLDKITTEIEAMIGEHNSDDYDFCSGLICARKIIDKYKEGDKE